jgi:hypothetical protein
MSKVNEVNEVQDAAIALITSKNDPRNNEKQHFQAQVRLVKAKLAANFKRDCYTKEELEIARSLPNFVEPTGQFGEDAKPKKEKVKA